MLLLELFLVVVIGHLEGATHSLDGLTRTGEVVRELLLVGELDGGVAVGDAGTGEHCAVEVVEQQLLGVYEVLLGEGVETVFDGLVEGDY